MRCLFQPRDYRFFLNLNANEISYLKFAELATILALVPFLCPIRFAHRPQFPFLTFASPQRLNG